ncbi:MAG: helix-turn-helix domain-containing protein [Cyanobacteria bacterium P01_A01_bin.135]
MASSREKLIQAASELFITQGISHTTTRQIANLAEVNEATLFRNFSNKYGLLLAVIQNAPSFHALHESLIQQAQQAPTPQASLQLYASGTLQWLEQASNFVRSLIGEADQYPAESRQALGHRLSDANHHISQFLEQAGPDSPLPPGMGAGILSALLVGYTVINATSEEHRLWGDREDFLTGLVTLLGSPSGERITPLPPQPVADLPAPWVQQILQQAKATGPQDYALAYLMFAAGLLPEEAAQARQSQHLSDKAQHTLRVGSRQVPINQWILGKRYGSYVSNPLTKWLKSRKDELPFLFFKDDVPLSVREIQQRWHSWTEPLSVPTQPRQAKQTWCVEMLMRGLTAENLSILSGWDIEQLDPYVDRAREKAALEEARSLDQKRTG